MKNILDILSVLTESTGLAGRNSGDVFKDADGNQIVFNELKLYPEEGGKYSPEEMTTVLNQLGQQVDIKWMNNRTARNGGIALISFDSENGPVVYGRYLEQVKPLKTDNFIPNTIDGYRLSTKSAEKMQSVLTPQDVLTDKTDLTSEDILSQIREKYGEDSPLYQVTAAVAAGQEFPIEFPKPPGVSFTAFRDHFCEILQPIALQVGLYTGNAGEAADKFLDGGFSNTLISFDSSKTAGLSDSIMTSADGKYIKVSTKGGKGAFASTKNLIDSLNELQLTDDGKKLLEKYEDELELLREIRSLGQINAPLYLGVKFDIITEQEAELIKKLRNIKPVKLADLEKLNLSDNLTRLLKKRRIENPEQINLFYHLLAAVATSVAQKVNADTNFSKAASDILNNGALVQVYTKAKEGKDTWTLQSFETVFPGDSIKGVFLTADKTHYSTGIKGNFTFKIVKDKEKPEKETDSSVDLATAAKDIVDRPLRKQAATKADLGAGREKRQKRS
jgi:hypothetical protein